MVNKKTKKKRRTKYQTGKQGMRKFAVKPGKYYYWSPIKQFSSKEKAREFAKKEKEKRPKSGIRHRVVKNPTKRKKSKYFGKFDKNYTVYRTFYP